MIWLTWRQFRVQLLVAVAVVAAGGAYLLVTGTQLRHAYSAALAACQSPSAEFSCFGTMNGLQETYNGPQTLAEFLVMAAPALIGIFWGAPLISAEFEHGTHRLAWNQSITRGRWLAVKLALPAVATVATAGLLSLLITWWASPLDTAHGNRWGTRAFNARDVVPLGYAVFAFVLGATIGLLLRRTLPAMAATLAVFVAVQIGVTADLRPHLTPPSTTSVAINQASMTQAIRFDRSAPGVGAATADLPGPAGAWIFSETPMLTTAGHPVADSGIAPCWNQAFGGSGQGGARGAGKGGAPGFGPLGACLAPENLHIDIKYLPASRYWRLQWTETALYTALAALLAGACFWRIRKDPLRFW